MEQNIKATIHYGIVPCSPENPMVLRKDILEFINRKLENNKNYYTKSTLSKHKEKMQEAYEDAMQDIISFLQV